MKNQALFSSKDKKLNCHLLQFLFGALRVKIFYFPSKELNLHEQTDSGLSGCCCSVVV